MCAASCVLIINYIFTKLSNTVLVIRFIKICNLVHNRSGDSDITLILNVSDVRKPPSSSFLTHVMSFLSELTCFYYREKRSKVPEVTNPGGRLAKRKAMLCLVEKSSNESSSSSSSCGTSQKSKTSRSVDKCAASCHLTVFLQQKGPSFGT